MSQTDAEFVKRAKKACKILEGLKKRKGQPMDWSEDVAIEIVGLACAAWDWKMYLVRYGQETKIWWEESVEQRKLYQVFQNDLPADFANFPSVDPSWKDSTFPTFEEAVAYARNWLGIYHDPQHIFVLDQPFQFEMDNSITIKRSFQGA